MSARLVLDASAALHAVLGGTGAERALAALDEATSVFAPGLYAAEVANALWKYVRAGELDGEVAVGALENAEALIDVVIPTGELAKEALVTATAAGHPVYDCLYAVLARREGATVLTTDRSFAELLATLSVPFLLALPEGAAPRRR